MIDSPYENWCAQVAQIMSKHSKSPPRRFDEDADGYCERVFGPYLTTRAFKEGSSPRYFAETCGRPLLESAEALTARLTCVYCKEGTSHIKCSDKAFTADDVMIGDW